MYLLSGGPAWTPDDCIKANFSRDTVTPRTNPLSIHEKKILSSPLSNIANQSSFIQSSTFLVDQQENLAHRFSNVAPMVMVIFYLIKIFLSFFIVIISFPLFLSLLFFFIPRIPSLLAIINVMVHII